MNQLISRVDSVIDDKQGQLSGNIIKEERYTYDKRGNLTEAYQGNNLINQYHFGALNRLEKAVNHQTKEVSEYLYTGLGHRVGKIIGAPVEISLPTAKLDTLTINPTKKIEDTIDLTKQYHNLLQRAEDSNVTSFTWDSNVLHAIGNGEETSSNERNNSYNQYLQDELGSPIRLFSPNGDMEELYSYDEFGQEIRCERENENVSQQSNILQPFTYTGYQRDSVANTYYAQAREYKSEIGRFTGEDIVKGSIVYPDTINYYTYCWNSPMDLVDIDGYAPQKAEKPVVFLDPGHGGEEDKGAAFWFIHPIVSVVVPVKPVAYYEKDANLKLALKVKTSLEAKNVTVHMSRTTDKGLELK